MTIIIQIATGLLLMFLGFIGGFILRSAVKNGKLETAFENLNAKLETALKDTRDECEKHWTKTKSVDDTGRHLEIAIARLEEKMNGAMNIMWESLQDKIKGLADGQAELHDLFVAVSTKLSEWNQ